MRATLQAIFATLAVFLIVSVAAIYWIGDRAIRKGKEVVKRRSDIDLLNNTLSTLKDAETGQRGYLLTLNDAIELYRRKKYDLFLSDLGLPDGSGIELLQKFKEIRAVPAIALTGFGMEEDIVRSQESGFFSHLTKPVNFKQLRELINRVPLA